MNKTKKLSIIAIIVTLMLSGCSHQFNEDEKEKFMDDCRIYAEANFGSESKSWSYEYEERNVDGGPVPFGSRCYHYCNVTDDLGLTFYITFEKEPSKRFSDKNYDDNHKLYYKDNYAVVLKEYLKGTETP